MGKPPKESDMQTQLTPRFLEKLKAVMARGLLPPQDIEALTEDILGDIRVAELRESVLAAPDEDLAQQIAFKKLRLEELYLGWMYAIEKEEMESSPSY